MIALIKRILGTKPDARILVGEDTVEKRRVYERALKGAAEDQKKLIADYHKKFRTP